MKLLMRLRVSGLTATAGVSLNPDETELKVLSEANFNLLDLFPKYVQKDTLDFKGKSYLDL